MTGVPRDPAVRGGSPWPGAQQGPSEADLRAAAGDDPGARQIADLWLETKAAVAGAFAVTGWAEEEITEAQKRHPGEADLLYHAFGVLRPGEGFRFPPAIGFVWRGHYRELLERVAAGQDTRPATYAEICLLLSAASERAPLTTDAFGLNIRAWCAAFPDSDVGLGALRAELAHYERMNGTGMDDLERMARAAVARRSGWRRYPPADGLACRGMHWGEPAPRCRFIPGTLDGLPAPAPARRAPGKNHAARAKAARREHLPGGKQADPDSVLDIIAAALKDRASRDTVND